MPAKKKTEKVGATKAIAEAEGLKFFVKLKPCSKGHRVRYVNTPSNCVDCTRSGETEWEVIGTPKEEGDFTDPLTDWELWIVTEAYFYHLRSTTREVVHKLCVQKELGVPEEEEIVIPPEKDPHHGRMWPYYLDEAPEGFSERQIAA